MGSGCACDIRMIGVLAGTEDEEGVPWPSEVTAVTFPPAVRAKRSRNGRSCGCRAGLPKFKLWGCVSWVEVSEAAGDCDAHVEIG